MNYRSLALAITALSSPQITPAAAQAVYVAPGGVYVGSGPVYVIPAPLKGAPPYGPTYGAAVVTGYGEYGEYGEYEGYWAYGADGGFGPCCAPGRMRPVRENVPA